MEGLNVAEEDEAKERVVSDDGVFTVSIIQHPQENASTTTDNYIFTELN